MTVIEFPGRKPAFKAVKFDLKQAIETYDDNREMVIFALNLLRHSPREVKRRFADIDAASKAGELRPDALQGIIHDTGLVIRRLRNLGIALQDAESRMVAVERDLRLSSPKVARRARAAQTVGADVQMVPLVGTVR